MILVELKIFCDCWTDWRWKLELEEQKKTKHQEEQKQTSEIAVFKHLFLELRYPFYTVFKSLLLLFSVGRASSALVNKIFSRLYYIGTLELKLMRPSKFDKSDLITALPVLIKTFCSRPKIQTKFCMDQIRPRRRHIRWCAHQEKHLQRNPKHFLCELKSLTLSKSTISTRMMT